MRDLRFTRPTGLTGLTRLLLLSFAIAPCQAEPSKPNSVGNDLRAFNFSFGEVLKFRIKGMGENAEMAGGNGRNILPLNDEGRPGFSGEVCCVMVVQQWRPGMQVELRWTYKPLSEQEAYKQITVYTAVVNIPPYEVPTHGTVAYFMPGNRVKFVINPGGLGPRMWDSRPAENDSFFVEGQVDEVATSEERKWAQFLYERLPNQRRLRESRSGEFDVNGKRIKPDPLEKP